MTSNNLVYVIIDFGLKDIIEKNSECNFELEIRKPHPMAQLKHELVLISAKDEVKVNSPCLMNGA